MVWARRRSKASSGAPLLQRRGDALEVDDLAHEGAHERVARPERADHHGPDDERYGGLLDGHPLRVELEQADAPSEQDAYDAHDGEEVEFPAAYEVVGAVAERKGQRDHEAASGAEPVLAAEQRQHGDWDDDVQQQAE